jgi:hypothetical protein
MRTIVVVFCLCATACGSHGPDSPAAPTSATLTPDQTQAQGGAELPFSGTFTIETRGAVNCPPTCPPTVLTITGTETGTATMLGRFAAASVDTVDIATATATGTMNFTAANGDRLMTTTIGGQDEFIPPNISSVRTVATIVGGTGRFANATGTFTVRYRGAIDYANGTSSGAGSFEGHITRHD